MCAGGAGIDRSNAPGDDWVVLLPADPDASAGRVRAALAARFRTAPAVIVSDSFGRAWRQGTTDVAIGKAGQVPGALVRGYSVPAGDGFARELVMPPERDLFP